MNRKNIDIIQASIDYIEENLKAEISAELLAERAGFSVFHYYRVFRKIVGIPVMQYITRRKLLHAAYAIANGGKVIETALTYGFGTNAGFYKAFMNEFNCSPSEYVKRYAVKSPYRMNLRQEEHSILTKKKLQEILTYWDLQKEEISDYYYTGTDYRADSQWNVGNRYVMKVGTDISRLGRHHEISKRLAEQGLEVPQPVKTKDGCEYYFDGELYYCLENKLEGIPINGRETYDNPSLARRIGEAIGILDLLLEDYEAQFEYSEANLPDELKEFAIPKMKTVTCKITDGFYEEFLSVLSELYDGLPKQIVHRDLCPNNFIVRGETIVGITDFELAEKNIRVYEPCYAAVAILSENWGDERVDQTVWFDILKNILCGYDRIAKLTKEEKMAVPYVIYGMQMSCISYFSEMDKFEELAETNVAMLEWLIDHFHNVLVC